jgi:N-glycosidase YbiA
VDIFFGDSNDQMFSWMSNFYRAPFKIEKEWQTTEHFYQAQKTGDVEIQERIRLLRTPYAAKLEGRKIALRPDWETVKESIMLFGLFAKFGQNRDLLERLVDTKKAILHENRNDLYWGYADGEGKDRLGQLLMKVRDSFIAISEKEKINDIRFSNY